MKISLFPFGFLLLVLGIPIHAQWANITAEKEGVYRTVKFHNQSDGLLLGHDGIVMKTCDKGESWNLLPNELSIDFFDFQFINDTMIYAYGSNKIYTSTDFGSTWTEMSSLPTNAQFAYFLDLETGFAGGNIEGLRRTTDGGGSWDMIWTHPAEDVGYSGVDDIDFINDSIGFVCGRAKKTDWRFYGNILKTIDRGLTWSIVFESTSTSQANQLVRIQINSDSSVIAVDEYLEIIKSDDFGKTWSVLPINKPDPESWFGMTVSSMYSHNLDTILVGAEVTVWLTKSGGDQKRKILRTTNGGQDWIVQFIDDLDSHCCGTPLLSSIHFLNDTIGFTTGNNLILRTTNTGGDTHIRDTIIFGSVEDQKGRPGGVNVFPNPATSTLNIQLSNSDYQHLDVLSMSGRMLDNHILNQSNQFDLTEYPAGMYILRFTGKKTYYHSLIKAAR